MQEEQDIKVRMLVSGQVLDDGAHIPGELYDVSYAQPGKIRESVAPDM